MKFRIHHVGMDSRDGTTSHVFASQSALKDFLWQHAWDNYHEGEAETLEEFKALFRDDVYDALERHHRDMLTYSEDQDDIDLVPVVPADAAAAARAGLEALIFARECFKASQSVRALDKTKDAISSAKGAVRHAEGKAAR